MKKVFILSILTVFVAACGARRPNPPQLSLLYGDAAGYYGVQSQYDVTVSDLSQVTIDWDVSYNPRAMGVVVVASRDYDCRDNIVAQSQSFIVSTYAEKENNPNYIDQWFTLYAIFAKTESSVDVIQKFTPGTYFICIRTYEYDGDLSTPSYPSIMNIRYY